MKKLKLSAFLAILGLATASAQTLTGTITTSPCNNNGVYSVSVVGLTMPITYTYYTGGATIVHANISSTSDQLANFSAHTSSYIYCIASDGTNTAYSSKSFYLPPFNLIMNPSPAVCPSTNGVLSVNSFSGTPGPFSYSWTELTTGVNILGNNATAPAGSYSLVVTDLVTGCKVHTDDTTAIINQESTINLLYNATLANCTNGAVNVAVSGGVPPYTYVWNTGATTASISNLTEGLYTVTVTDAQGCVNNYNWGAYVQQLTLIQVAMSATPATCSQNDGSASVVPTGGTPPYSYMWATSQTTQSISGLSAGVYVPVIVTDVNGCIGKSGVSVISSTPIQVTFTAQPSACTAPTGSATLTIVGGTAPYTTVWNSFSGTTTNTTINGVAPGSYGFKVTDALGCVQTGTVQINSPSTLVASLTSSTVICPVNVGSIYSSVSGTNPPFTYSWSDGSTTAQLNNAALGSYTCVITDAMGCSVSPSGGIYAISPIHVGLTATSASCVFNADGISTAHATGGTGPYTYNWAIGQSGASATGLLSGWYSVSVTDANGCAAGNAGYVGFNTADSSCYCTISGKVYNDANSNCVLDAGEIGVRSVMINCTGVGAVFTDVNGNYNIQVPSGTYTVSESTSAAYPLAACQSNSQVVTVTAGSGCNTSVNFANNILPVHDLRIFTTSFPFSAPTPGNTYGQRVIIQNDGTVMEPTIQIGYVTDGKLGSFTSNPNLFTKLNATVFPNWYSVQSGFTNLVPGTSDVINLTYNTPTNIPLGTLVDFYDTTAHAAPINPTWLTDQTPWNNVQHYQRPVVASFDPNFKEVSPMGIGSQGYITSKDSLLSYIIHFQNEGTYFAQNISVVDTLDSDLDWSTLRPGYSDHSYTTTVSETGVITFKFANINLPWKQYYGDLISSGMVSYTIKRKRNLPQGTQFKNTAAIYFDYNAPVITNTTINTLNDVVTSVDEKVLLDNSDVVLYPNPTANMLNISINVKQSASKGQVIVVDITGKVLSSQDVTLEMGNNLMSQNTTDLSSGIYFVQVKFNESFITKKLVIIK